MAQLRDFPSESAGPPLGYPGNPFVTVRDVTLRAVRAVNRCTPRDSNAATTDECMVELSVRHLREPESEESWFEIFRGLEGKGGQG
jgi:hypothetical protein